jgi:hypothetical protein
MTLVASDGNQIDLTGSSLGLRLQEIYDGRYAELQGNAISAIEDENCYFLTTKGAWGINSVALYGDDGSEPSATLVGGIREAAILAARDASAEKHSTQQQSAYPYCNVYADIACFGIASGDEVTMRRPADFSLFDIRLAGGAVGTVYVGEHADISDAPFRNEAEQCIDTEKRCVFVSRANGGLWAIYIKASGTQLEVRIPQLGQAQEARAVDFLSGFKECATQIGSIICETTPLFDKKSGSNATG